MVVDAGEHVEERPLGRRREPDAAGRDDRYAKGRGQIDERLVVGVFVPPEMTLELDEHRLAAEEPDGAIEQPADAVPLPVERRPSDERDQTARRAVEILERQRALAFRGARASCA